MCVPATTTCACNACKRTPRYRRQCAANFFHSLICGDVKIAKINTELLTLNIQAIDWAGPRVRHTFVPECSPLYFMGRYSFAIAIRSPLSRRIEESFFLVPDVSRLGNDLTRTTGSPVCWRSPAIEFFHAWVYFVFCFLSFFFSIPLSCRLPFKSNRWHPCIVNYSRSKRVDGYCSTLLGCFPFYQLHDEYHFAENNWPLTLHGRQARRFWLQFFIRCTPVRLKRLMFCCFVPFVFFREEWDIPCWFWLKPISMCGVINVCSENFQRADRDIRGFFWREIVWYMERLTL